MVPLKLSMRSFLKNSLSRKPIDILIGGHLVRKIAKVGVIVGIRQIILAVINFCYVIVLSRLLPPEVFGVIALAAFFQTFLATIIQSSFAESIVQAPSLSLDQINKVFWRNASLGVIAALILLAVSPLAVSFYSEPRLYYVMFMMAASMLIQVAFVPFQALLERNMLIEWLTVVSMVPPLVNLIVATSVALMGGEIWSVLFGTFCDSMTRAILLVAAISWIPRKSSKGVDISSISSYGLRNVGGAIVGFLSRNIQVLALGKWASPTEVAFYNRGQSIFQRPVRQLAAPMVNVVFPKMCKEQHNRERVLDIIVRSTWTVGLGMLPLAAAFVCFGDWISVFLLGGNWTTSGEVVRYLALGEVPTLLMMALVRGNAAVGRPAKGLYVTLGILPVLIGGVFLWAEDGAIAVAQFIVVLRWVCMPLYLWIYLREVGFSRKVFLHGLFQLVAIFISLVALGFAVRDYVATSTVGFNFLIGLLFLFLSYLYFGICYAACRLGREILIWILDAVGMILKALGIQFFANWLRFIHHSFSRHTD